MACGTPRKAARPLRVILRNTILKMLGFNLSIVLLVLVVLIPVYRMSYRSAQRTVQTNLQQSMQTNFQMLMADLRALETYVSMLAKEPSMTYLAYLKDVSGLHAAKAVELHQQLVKPFSSQDKLFDDIIIHLPGSKYVIMKSGVYGRDAYYGLAIRYPSFTKKAYEDALFEDKAPFFPAMPLYTSNYGAIKDSVTLNYFSKTKTNIYHAISVMIRVDTLQNRLVLPMLSGRGYVRLYKDDTLLFAYNGGGEDIEDFLPISADAAYRVEYGISRDVYQSNVSAVARMVALYCAIALMLAAVYSAFMLARIFIPVRECMHLLDAMNGPIQDFYTDNLVQYMRTSLLNITVHASDLARSLLEIKRDYMDMTLRGLLHGVKDIDREAIREIERDSGFPRRFVLVALYWINHEKEIIRYPDEQDGREEEAAGEMRNAYVFPEHPFLLAIDSREAYVEDIRRLCGTLCRDGRDVYAAVSAPHEGAEMLQTAYEEIRGLMRSAHPFLHMDNPVIQYGVQPDATAADVKLSQEVLARLLCHGRLEDLDMYLRALIRKMGDTALSMPRRVSFYYYWIIDIYEGLFSSLGMERTLAEFDPDTSLSETEAYITATGHELHGHLLARREKAQPHENIVEYVQKHYRESRMSLGFLSQEFSLSEAYISRIIKRCTGMSYLDFVEKLRMEHATTLLVEGDGTVGDIIAALGYDNENTFFKAFKRRYGISPGAYRSAHQTGKPQA